MKKEEHKQETIQQAISRIKQDLICEGRFPANFETGFIEGIEWKKEKMYSENEVFSLLLKYQQGYYCANNEKGLRHWFNNVKKIIAIVLFFPLLTTAQHRPHFWAKQGFNTALAMYAGFTRHERDVIREKYKAYQAVWPKAKPQWSNPQLSRYNKYKNGNVAEGRAKLLGVNKPVFLTDKYHLSTTIIRTSYAGIVGLNMSLYERHKVKHILLQALVTFAADAAGNGISTLIYKY